ncbi:MAG TPA: TolC family protein [Mariprofundaceae bacterium]|nr:TolC family protein [Mariprofundaceae bacterium]
MRIQNLIAGMSICLYPWLANAITLDEAMTLASKQHPSLTMAQNNVEAARAQRDERSAYAYNPEISLEPQRRHLNGGGTSNDYYITLSQGIELGGKPTYRKQAAEAFVNEAGFAFQDNEQKTRTAAAKAFVDLYFGRQSYELRKQQAEMLLQVNEALRQQLLAGQASQLDANLAGSTYIAAVNALTSAQQQLSQSKVNFSMALGVGHEAFSQLELPKLSGEWQPPSNPVEVALQSRPDLAALKERMQRTHSESELAGAARIPDITLSAMTGRETGDRLVKFGVTVPLPVWNTHKGAYKSALAQEDNAKTELAWREQQMRQEVRAVLDNYNQAIQTLKISAGSDQTSLETISLARQAYQAGELDLEELVVHAGQGLDGQLAALEARHQAWLALIQLAETLGHPEFIFQGESQ